MDRAAPTSPCYGRLIAAADGHVCAREFGRIFTTKSTKGYEGRYSNIKLAEGQGGFAATFNASAPFEGWNLAINGTKGRLESQITDNKPSPGWQGKHQIVGPDGKTLKGQGYRVTDWLGDYSIHVMPHTADDFEIKLPNIADGHGGGDFKIMDAALADNYPESDELDIFASAIHGARSTAIGAAANQSIASGKPVSVKIGL